MSWCKSGVGFQDLPFIDNRHLGSIHRFQQSSCFIRNTLELVFFYKVLVKEMLASNVCLYSRTV